MMNLFSHWGKVIMKENAGDISGGKEKELHNKTRKKNAISIKKMHLFSADMCMR